MLLKDKKIIVTGGPTREWLDPVRFISNASSGKMGICLADEAFHRGRETVFIHGPIESALVKGKPYRVVSVDSTDDMLNAVVAELVDGAVLVMSAAPADYTAQEKSREKIKKSDDDIVLHLKKTPDILKNVAALREAGRFSDLFVVGFAAETTNLEEYATTKLRVKNLEMICLNDVSHPDAGFSIDTNIITIFKKDGSRIKLPKLSKQGASEKIFDQVEFELSRR